MIERWCPRVEGRVAADATCFLPVGVAVSKHMLTLPSLGRMARLTPLVAVAAHAAMAPRARAQLPSPVRITDHVIVISVDGLRPDAIERFNAPTLRRLAREGAWAAEAHTVVPSTTLPSHTSMLTGLEVADHGVIWNSDQVAERGTITAPTVFTVAKAHGLRTAAFFSKAKFKHLAVPGSLDHVEVPQGRVVDALRTTDETAAAVRRYLRSDAPPPNLLVVHLAETDYAGHGFGWMGSVYGGAVRVVDRAVAGILEQADVRFGPGRYTVILTADHGGHGRVHGSDDPRHTRIPWIAWGEGVRAGLRIPRAVRTMDTAASALWLLGVAPPGDWVGRPVTEAFAGMP